MKNLNLVALLAILTFAGVASAGTVTLDQYNLERASAATVRTFYDSSQVYTYNSAMEQAQTVRVGLDGALSRIEVLAWAPLSWHSYRNDELWLDVRTASTFGEPARGNSASSVLGSVSVSTSQLSPSGYGWIGFDLSGLGLQVSHGDVFAFSLRLIPADDRYDVGSVQVGTSYLYDPREHRWPLAGAYAPGQMYYRSAYSPAHVPFSPPEGSWTPTSRRDLNFRTYVEVQSAAGPAGTPPAVPLPGAAGLGFTLLGVLGAGKCLRRSLRRREEGQV